MVTNSPFYMTGRQHSRKMGPAAPPKAIPDCKYLSDHQSFRLADAEKHIHRSGNRSKTASSTLADLGYTNIYEFGGINTWPYETEP